MGEVYLAQDTRLGRKVAIKVLPAEFASDPERLARFEQEARAAASGVGAPRRCSLHRCRRASWDPARSRSPQYATQDTS